MLGCEGRYKSSEYDVYDPRICIASLRKLRLSHSPRIQIGDDVAEPADGLHFLDRPTVEHGVGIGEPTRGNLAVAAGDGIERAKQADEQDSELERLGAGLKSEFASLHSRNCCLAHADDAGEDMVADIELISGADDGLGDDGARAVPSRIQGLQSFSDAEGSSAPSGFSCLEGWLDTKSSQAGASLCQTRALPTAAAV